jgi:hypothetical protein
MKPDFDELIAGEELGGGERQRLQHVHDLLVQAGPPPELPPSLVRGRVHQLRPQVRGRALVGLLAATLAIVVFGAGYLVGHGGNGTKAAAFSWAKPLRATAAAPGGALGTIEGMKGNGSGNWQMRVTVSGLKPLPARAYYVVYLTRGGKRIAPCGFFRIVRPGATSVQMNVPYTHAKGDGWIVLAYQHERPGPPLLST